MSRAGTEGIFSLDHRRLTIGLLSLIVMIAFEALAVATAMPAAARDLNGLALYSWGFTGFLTASLFATATVGDICDRVGPRIPLLVGGAVFAVGLLVAGSAPTMGTFVLGRVVQGLGGGTAIVALFVAVAAFPGHLRPKILAALAACWVLPSVLGPPLAGILTETLSWRWVFWALIPLVPIPLFLALPGVSGMTGSGAAHRWSRIGFAVLLAVGVAGLQYAGQLVSADPTVGGGATSGGAVPWLTVGLLAGVGLAVVVLSVRQFLPAGTLRLQRGLPSVVAMRGFLAGAFFASEAFIPLMLIEHRGWSVTFAGMALTGAALGWATGSWLQGGRPKAMGATERRDRASRFARRGGILVAAGVLTTGLGVISTDDVSVPSLITPAGWLLAGLGMGMAMSAVSVLLFELSPVELRGANSAALQICDHLGSITVLAVAGLIYAVGRATLPGSVLFGGVFLVTILVAVGSAVVATRVLPSVAAARQR